MTVDEYEAMRRWNSQEFQAIMKCNSPLLVTDLSRDCIMGDADVEQQVRYGIERDGSSMGWLNVSELSWKKTGRGQECSVVIRIGARGAGQIAKAMTSRVLHGNSFSLVAANCALRISAAQDCGWRENDDGELNLEVTTDVARAIAQELRANVGTYSWPGLAGLTIEVVLTEIRDQQGSIVRTIG